MKKISILMILSASVLSACGGGQSDYSTVPQTSTPTGTTGNTTQGQALYSSTAKPMACSICHGTNVSANISRIKSGASASVIKNAITSNMGGMGIYAAMTDTDLNDIAAYIATQ